MAHYEDLMINGVLTPVMKFDSSAQEIDDATRKVLDDMVAGACIAEYAVTTLDQIKEAVASGKMVILKRETSTDQMFGALYALGESYARFAYASIDRTTTWSVETGDVWSETVEQNENLTDINDVPGVLAVSKGGTGADTTAGARAKLGAAPAYTFGTEELTPGVSPLEDGTLYFCYE